MCGLQEGEFPRRRRARAVPARRRPARDRHRQRPAAAAARGPPRPRALPLLRLRLARRAAAGAELALRATRRATRRPRRSSSRTCATCSRGRCRDAARSLSDVTWTADGRAHGGRVGARAGARRGPRRERAAAAPLDRRARCWSAWPSAARSPPARSSTSPTARSSGWSRTCCGPIALEPDPEQMVRGSYAHAVLERTYERLREETGDRRVTPANLAARGAHPGRGAARPARRVPALAEADARAGRRPAAGVRPAALPAPRGRARRQLRARAPRAPVRRRRRQPPVEIEPGLTRARAHRPRRRLRRPWRSCATTRAASASTRYKVGALGGREPLPGGALHARRRAAAGAASRRAASTCRSGSADAPRGMVADGVEELGVGLLRATTGSSADEFRAELDWARGQVARDRRAACAAASSAARPTRAPGTAAARTPRSAGRGMTRAAADRRAASARSARRDGSLLVRAGAGTGKTSVLVERFVRAVVEDERAGRRRSSRSRSPRRRRPR